MTFSLRLPESRLERVRLTLTLMGVLLCLLVSLQAIHSRVDTPHVLLSVAATLANVGLIGFTAHRRDDTSLLLIPISAVLAVMTGIGIDDPISAAGCCSGLVIGQTMYGSRRSVFLRLALLLPVIPLSVAFSASPLREGVDWHSQATLSAVPLIPVLGILIFVLRGGLESQAAALARESFSATLNSRLLNADTVADVEAAMVRANADLTRLSPGQLTPELIRTGPGESQPEGAMRAPWRKAMARVEARSELITACEQDGVTGLADRSATMRRIAELMQGNRDPAMLVIFQLGGLDRVEETGGVAAADAVMVELAHRITNLVPDDCHVGRGGDQAFTVVLPHPGPPEVEALPPQVQALVEQLEAALLEPVPLATGAVQLALRTGMAPTARSGTAAELLERASRAVVLDSPGNRYGTRVPEPRR